MPPETTPAPCPKRLPMSIQYDNRYTMDINNPFSCMCVHCNKYSYYPFLPCNVPRGETMKHNETMLLYVEVYCKTPDQIVYLDLFIGEYPYTLIDSLQVDIYFTICHQNVDTCQVHNEPIDYCILLYKYYVHVPLA